MIETLLAVVVEADELWKSAYIPAVIAIVKLLRDWYGISKKLIPPLVIALCIIGRVVLFGGGLSLTNLLWGVTSGAGAMAGYDVLKMYLSKGK